MPAGCSDRSRNGPSAAAALALLALSLAACQTRDPSVRPFRITAVDASGASVVEGFAQPGLVVVEGAASRPDATTLVVTPAAGALAVTIRFDAAGEPVAFPDTVAQGNVRVEIRHDPASRGPAGEPLPVRGLRMTDATGRYRFFIGEGNLSDPQGIPLVPRPLGPESPNEDLPTLVVVAPGTTFEPSDCGDVYYDRLLVTGVDRETVLGQHETASVLVPGAEGLPRWLVRHVTSWHRAERVSGSDCQGALPSWFQASAVR